MSTSMRHIAQSTNRRKVKTGCRTCKARRVKCDESRPACRRCISTGRTCDGYGIWGGGGSPYGPPQANKALSIYCTPVPAGCLTREEQTCFDWFMSRTTTKFAGVFASLFWETLVFQASAQEPAVRHAIVALSVAHRSNVSSESIPARYGMYAERFILLQYNKAIQHLRGVTTGPGGSSKTGLRVTLITCMLFVTLEYLRGQHKMGSAHLGHGIQLLANVSAPAPRTSMAPSILSPAEDFVHDALVESYARLAIQSAMFGHVPSHLCVIVRDPQLHALPHRFPSLVEARQALDDLLTRIHCLERYIYSVPADDGPGTDPEAFETQRRIMADLLLWRKAYNASLSLKTDACKEKIGFLLLRVYYEMAMIMASVCLSREGEMVFDAYTNDFVGVMTAFFDMRRFWSTTSLPIKEQHMAFQNGQSECNGYSFTIESGFIPPIYYTGLKCRVLKIRRLAIRLLRAAPHREGLWNGPLVADVLEEVVRVEHGSFHADDDPNQDLDERLNDADFQLEKDDLPSSDATAESRISDVEILLSDVVDGDTFMKYRQKGEDGQWANFHHKVNRTRRQSWSIF
ncbi:hypothetical protein BDV37DRAFT_242349 [Aspergillus pseudonomiae]|uniref:Zn(2)-C6 fungal-type domain-containing protein n=1 Tax=Aspergillus pseudonomiae TaxID=1506151 RepID=A0A5N7DJM6_9EURO|nr:uncharacterized protein BDV37DRAFT_242349 [Aspergillus pseudonomiae]KAE8406641.1 hypothetical protein BDV37DRAFT_242349 [Aspergillus pseudonomiae]